MNGAFGYDSHVARGMHAFYLLFYYASVFGSCDSGKVESQPGSFLLDHPMENDGFDSIGSTRWPGSFVQVHNGSDSGDRAIISPGVGSVGGIFSPPSEI